MQNVCVLELRVMNAYLRILPLFYCYTEVVLFGDIIVLPCSVLEIVETVLLNLGN